MKGFAVHLELPVLWGDMDGLRHVNNARYFTWFESARIAWFDALRGRAHLPPGVGPILAATSCDYRAPLVYPAELEVGMRVARIGRTSIHTEMAVARVGDATPAATGTAVVVLLHYEKGETVPVPDELRAAMEAAW